MDFKIPSLILLLYISDSLTLKPITVICEGHCALRYTDARLTCKYDNIHNKTAFWFSEKQSNNWRKNNAPEDLTLDSDYAGRVKQIIGKYEAELIISDVTERDSGEYQLVFVEDGVKQPSSAAVSLTVKDLQVRSRSKSLAPRNETVELTCETNCGPEYTTRNYYWYKNNLQLPETSRNIIVSPENAGSYSCSCPQSRMHSSSPVCVFQSSCWEVTYTSRRVCALVGSTVDISSTYSHPPGHTVNKIFWHHSSSGGFRDLREEHQFAGRVEYVENKLRIKDLKISDSGEYRLGIITDVDQYFGSPGVILTVTGTHMKISQYFVSERQEMTLICSTKCTLSNNHIYIWYKNGRQVTDGFTKDNKLYLDSVSSEELQQYSCAVELKITDPVNSTAFSHYTVTLLVFLPQFLIIAALWMWFFIQMHRISKPN